VILAVVVAESGQDERVWELASQELYHASVRRKEQRVEILGRVRVNFGGLMRDKIAC